MLYVVATSTREFLDKADVTRTAFHHVSKLLECDVNREASPREQNHLSVLPNASTAPPNHLARCWPVQASFGDRTGYGHSPSSVRVSMFWWLF